MHLWHQIVVRTNSMPQATDKWHDWCSYLVLKSSLGYQRMHGRPNGLWKLFMADNVICTSYNYVPVISVMLVGAKYLRVGNCLFLWVHGWGGEHKVKKYIYIFANSWRLSISSNWPIHYVEITLSPLNQWNSKLILTRNIEFCSIQWKIKSSMYTVSSKTTHQFSDLNSKNNYRWKVSYSNWTDKRRGEGRGFYGSVVHI